MKKQQWFKRTILERFFDKEELENFEVMYNSAKYVNVGRRSFKK